MEGSFSNGASKLRRLNSYLEQTRQRIARVRNTTASTIRQTESDLYQVHADNAPQGLLRLLREMDLASGEEDPFANNDINQTSSKKNQGGAANSDKALFRLSQKQIWSNFAREITKSLKRNM